MTIPIPQSNCTLLPRLYCPSRRCSRPQRRNRGDEGDKIRPGLFECTVPTPVDKVTWPKFAIKVWNMLVVSQFIVIVIAIATIFTKNSCHCAIAFNPSINIIIMYTPYITNIRRTIQRPSWLMPRKSSKKDDDVTDSENDWTTLSNRIVEEEDDWQKILLKKQDGSFWSSFEPSADDAVMSTDRNDNNDGTKSTKQKIMDDDMIADMWIDQLQALASKEVEFNMQEADRADKVRQMEEYGFDREIIQNALGVAMDTTLEVMDEVKGMQMYREESFWDNVDLTTVESHTQVEKDTETLEPTRLQMVYVDEHTCIGCTNCAMIAQSTFFMHPEHGRARVFQQWGDTDETIQIAIETCPVDCIHYVPYDELVSLEIDRRNQNINFKARLVSQAENGNTLSHLSGRGTNAYTAPQQISGNMKSRCNNCPSRGCRACPMYGVGKNPAFEAAEQLRKEKIKKRQVQQQRERDEKSIEL